MKRSRRDTTQRPIVEARRAVGVRVLDLSHVAALA